MTFLNPLILIGLFAVAIPVIIHLLNLRKFERIEFSTLMFLKDIQKKKARRIRLKDLLLLLLRISIIAFLVLLFASPIFKSELPVARNAPVLRMIFIDNSKSTGLLQSEMLDAALKLIPEFGNEDKLYIFSSNELFDSIKFKTLPQTVFLEFNNSDYVSILKTAKNIAEKNHYASSALYIISDFQKINFIDKAYNDNLRQDFKPEIYLINILGKNEGNISVNGARYSYFKIYTHIRNYNPVPIGSIRVNLEINSRKTDEIITELQPFESKNIEFKLKNLSTGIYKSKIYLETSAENGYKFDDTLAFELKIPESFTIGLLESEKAKAEMLKKAFEFSGINANISEKLFKNESELTEGYRECDIIIKDENLYFSESLFGINEKFTAGGLELIIPRKFENEFIPDTLESNPAVMSEKDLKEYFGETEFVYAKTSEELNSRPPIVASLWNLIYIFLIIVLISETIIILYRKGLF